jgi:hypothetical protein
MFFKTNHNTEYKTKGYAKPIAVEIRSMDASPQQANISA